MSEVTLLIFGKAVSIIAAAGIYLHILERSADSKRSAGVAEEAEAKVREDRVPEAA